MEYDPRVHFEAPAPDSVGGSVALAVAVSAVVVATMLIMAVAVASARFTLPRESLSTALSAPSELTMVYPGGSVDYGRQDGPDGATCTGGRYFADVAVYTWPGGFFARPTFTAMDGYRWHSRAGTVTFDGRKFTNRSSAKVLIAAWCQVW